MTDTKDFCTYYKAVKNVNCPLDGFLVTRMMDGFNPPKYPEKVKRSKWVELNMEGVTGGNIQEFCDSLSTALLKLKDTAQVPKDVEYNIDVDFYNEDVTFSYETKPDVADLDNYSTELNYHMQMSEWAVPVDIEYQRLMDENKKNHNDDIERQIEELRSKLK